MLRLIKRFMSNEDGFLNFLLPLAGAAIAGNAAKKAAGTQAQAAKEASDVNERIFDKSTALFEPFREAGERALDIYENQLGTDFTQTPGYDFQRQQGIDAIDASAASRGNLFSGATLQAVNQFGQDYATNAYENWLNRIGGLVSTGQASAGNQAALGQNFANSQANLLTQGAAARAGGQLGVANAFNSGLDAVGGIFNYQNAAPTSSPRPAPRPY